MTAPNVHAKRFMAAIQAAGGEWVTAQAIYDLLWPEGVPPDRSPRVSKMVRRLRDRGAGIETERGKGFRFTGGTPEPVKRFYTGPDSPWAAFHARRRAKALAVVERFRAAVFAGMTTQEAAEEAGISVAYAYDLKAAHRIGVGRVGGSKPGRRSPMQSPAKAARNAEIERLGNEGLTAVAIVAETRVSIAIVTKVLTDARKAGRVRRPVRAQVAAPPKPPRAPKPPAPAKVVRPVAPKMNVTKFSSDAHRDAAERAFAHAARLKHLPPVKGDDAAAMVAAFLARGGQVTRCPTMAVEAVNNGRGFVP